MREKEVDEISKMMCNLSSKSIRDVVCHYLLAQPPVAALGYVNAWYSHWRRQVLYHRDFSRKINQQRKKKDKIKKDPKNVRYGCLNRKSVSNLEKLYISKSEFSDGDKASMLACFSRYVNIRSKQINYTSILNFLNRNFSRYSVEVLRFVII